MFKNKNKKKDVISFCVNKVVEVAVNNNNVNKKVLKGAQLPLDTLEEDRFGGKKRCRTNKTK